MKKTERVTAVTKRLLYGCLFTVTVLLLAGFGKHADNRGLRGNFAIPQSDTQKPLIKKNISKIDERILLQKDTLPPAPVFKTMNIADLRKETKTMKPIKKVLNPLVTAPMPNAGNDAYKNGSGVVLSPLNATHSPTMSLLTIYNLTYSWAIASYIRNNIPFSVYQIVNAPQGVSIANKLFTFLYARYKDLPTGVHTYLLTLGTSVSADQTKIAIYNSDRSSYAEFEGSDFVYNPGANEIRLLFSFGDIIRGSDGSYQLDIIVSHKSKSSTNVYAYFNHLQLVQID